MLITFKLSGLPRPSVRIIGGLLTLAALLLLQACSAVKLAYNNAPEFGFWWLDAYADFNDSQTPKVRAELARLLQWHRTDELPKLAELLQKTQKLANADLTPAPVCALFGDVRLRLTAINLQAEPVAVALAQTLTADQIIHIEKKFAKNNSEWRDEWQQATPSQRFEKRLKSSVERSEEFYGKFDDRQVAVLRTAMEAAQFDSQLSYGERVRRQQDLLDTLRRINGMVAGGGNAAKPSAADALTAVRAYLDRSLNSPNPAYRAYSEKQIADSCATFATLHNSTTPEQRGRAVRRLAAYERDVRELNSQR